MQTWFSHSNSLSGSQDSSTSVNGMNEWISMWLKRLNLMTLCAERRWANFGSNFMNESSPKAGESRSWWQTDSASPSQFLSARLVRLISTIERARSPMASLELTWRAWSWDRSRHRSARLSRRFSRRLSHRLSDRLSHRLSRRLGLRIAIVLVFAAETVRVTVALVVRRNALAVGASEHVGCAGRVRVKFCRVGGYGFYRVHVCSCVYVCHVRREVPLVFTSFNFEAGEIEKHKFC